MAWYDYIPGVAAGKAAAGALGINKDTLFGGLGKSTNPSDYATPYAHQDQIMGAITPGLATSRTAPQAGMDSQFRQAQINQLGQLQGIASGQQQGAGELAAQRQTQNALAQQQAMARMARGGNAALAQRGAANNAAGIGLAGAGMSQQAAMQDQQAAQGLLTQAAGQGRGQDQQVQLANMDAKLRQMGMDDQARLGYLQQLTGMDASQLQAQIAAMQAATGQQGLIGPLLGQAGQLASFAAMASDERAKTDITDARDEVDEMLDSILPKAYVYKDQSKHGVGRRVGFMVQDLERSKAGKQMVVDDIGDGVKGVDINKAVSAALASSARLHERLRKLERKAG